MAKILIVLAIISILIGILFKSGYCPFKSPFDLSALAYLRFADTLLLLAISIACVQLGKKGL